MESVILVIAFGVSAALGFVLRSGALRGRFLDHPNTRSLHHAPVPRSGGLAIHTAVGVAALGLAALAVPLPPAAFWISWLAVVAVSLLDDTGHVPAGARLVVHIAAVAFLLWGLAPAGLPVAWTIVAGLALAWFINLFNFMDGMDGLAGLMALTGSLCLAAAGLLAGDVGYALLLASVAAAAAGFLLHNLPPARLFMGDAGSIGLGFLLGALGFEGVVRGLFPWSVPVLAFLPFIADATGTLLARILRGRRPWEAHREHVYQRLVLAGRSVRGVLVIEFLIMLCSQVGALLIVAMRETA